jgi:hypothetical protein
MCAPAIWRRTSTNHVAERRLSDERLARPRQSRPHVERPPSELVTPSVAWLPGAHWDRHQLRGGGDERTNGFQHVLERGLRPFLKRLLRLVWTPFRHRAHRRAEGLLSSCPKACARSFMMRRAAVLSTVCFTIHLIVLSLTLTSAGFMRHGVGKGRLGFDETRAFDRRRGHRNGRLGWAAVQGRTSCNRQ